MGNQEEQKEYFAEISNEYDTKYQDPEKIIEYEKLHRLEAAIDLITNDNHQRVLDIGVGSGEFFRRYSSQSDTEFVGLDISFPMLQTARTNEKTPEYCQGTVTDIPLSSNSIDLVTCLGVIGYTEREKISDVIHELHRILRSGGQAILSFANRESPYRQFRQLYYYKLMEIGKQITGLGTPVTSGYNTYRPSNVCSILNEEGFRLDDFRYLTFSTGIWNTNFNIKVYKIFDQLFSDRDFAKKLAMTWVVAAQKV